MEPDFGSLLDKLRAALDSIKNSVEEVGGKIEAATTKGHSAENDKQTPIILTAALSRSQSEIDNEEARETRKERREARNERQDRRRMRLETIALGLSAVLVIANIIILAVYWLQLSQTVLAVDAQSAQMQQTRRDNARTLSQSQAALNATIQQFQLDQRPWIGPKDFEMLPMSAPNPIKAKCTIVNSGKTPAFRVRIDYFLHPSDSPIDPVEYMRHPAEKRGEYGMAAFTIFPASPTEMIPQTGSTDRLGIESVNNGRKLIYFFASITYEDSFQRIHHTRFCGLYDHVVKQFLTCPGNYDYAD